MSRHLGEEPVLHLEKFARRLLISSSVFRQQSSLKLLAFHCPFQTWKFQAEFWPLKRQKLEKRELRDKMPEEEAHSPPYSSECRDRSQAHQQKIQRVL